jgi:hypothetical protein
MRLACLALAMLLAAAAPARADELHAATSYRVAGPEGRPMPFMHLVPAALRPLLDRRSAARRPKPGATSLFEPAAMVPLVGARDLVELGLGFGRTGSGRQGTDRDRGNVVVVYVGAGW